MEHNRGKDLEIPLYELEQRVDHMEQLVSHLQTDNVESLTEYVAIKFRENLSFHLPKVF